jgi:hypothetical protein
VTAIPKSDLPAAGKRAVNRTVGLRPLPSLPLKIPAISNETANPLRLGRGAAGGLRVR